MQLEAIASRPIASCLGEETNIHLTTWLQDGMLWFEDLFCYNCEIYLHMCNGLPFFRQ